MLIAGAPAGRRIGAGSRWSSLNTHTLMVSLSNHEGNTASSFDKLRMRQDGSLALSRTPFLLPMWEKVARSAGWGGSLFAVYMPRGALDFQRLALELALSFSHFNMDTFLRRGCRGREHSDQRRHV